MDFLHKQLELKSGDVVEVTLDHAANVQLLNAGNFERYKNRQTYEYYGGHATESPMRIQVPQDGIWHLVVDLGGAAGRVKASVSVLSTTPAA